METKEKISKFYIEFRDKCNIQLMYEGFATKEDNMHAKDEQIQNFLKNYENIFNIKTDISIIRTFFQDMEETKLNLTVTGCGRNKEIEYVNGALVKYEDDENNIHFHYENGRLNFSAYNKSLEHYPLLNFILERKSKYIKELESADGFDFEKIDKRIIDLYIAFFGETPDFSEKKIKEKIRLMIDILYILNIYPKKDNFESLNSKEINGITEFYSDVMNNVLDELYAFGKISENKRYSNIDEKYLNYAKNAQKILKENNDNYDKIFWLKELKDKISNCYRKEEKNNPAENKIIKKLVNKEKSPTN